MKKMDFGEQTLIEILENLKKMPPCQLENLYKEAENKKRFPEGTA